MQNGVEWLESDVATCEKGTPFTYKKYASTF